MADIQHRIIADCNIAALGRVVLLDIHRTVPARMKTIICDSKADAVIHKQARVVVGITSKILSLKDVIGHCHRRLHVQECFIDVAKIKAGESDWSGAACIHANYNS
jgi:hypothetical protein